jgi:hypothetical protein
MGAIQSVRVGDNHEEREGHEVKANGGTSFFSASAEPRDPGQGWLMILNVFLSWRHWGDTGRNVRISGVVESLVLKA